VTLYSNCRTTRSRISCRLRSSSKYEHPRHHPSLPARTVKDSSAGQARPGALNYGSAGSGSSQHLAASCSRKWPGSTWCTFVQGRRRRGRRLDCGPGATDVGSATSLPYVRSGRLVALAVTTAQRVASVPNLPTIANPDCPAMRPPPGMPSSRRRARPNRCRQNAGGSRAHIETPRRARATRVRNHPAGGSGSAEFAEFLKREIVKWARSSRNPAQKSTEPRRPRNAGQCRRLRVNFSMRAAAALISGVNAPRPAKNINRDRDNQGSFNHEQRSAQRIASGPRHRPRYAAVSPRTRAIR